MAGKTVTRRGSSEWRERVGRGKRRAEARKKEAMRIAPRDLANLTRGRDVRKELRPLLSIATEEAGEILGALGGLETASPQQHALVEDFATTGIVLRALTRMFLANPDPELASRISTLVGARRSTLSLLGLARYERELDFTQGVDVQWDIAPEDAPGDAISSAPDTQGTSTDDRGASPGPPRSREVGDVMAPASRSEEQ